MDHAGAPTIRFLDVDGRICAIDGSHVIAQAHERGLVAKLIIVETDLPGVARVPSDLPAYHFDHVLALYERSFT